MQHPPQILPFTQPQQQETTMVSPQPSIAAQETLSSSLPPALLIGGGLEETPDDPVKPHHYEDGIPVFLPTTKQFQNFKEFIESIDPYGKRAGLAKIVPPASWIQSQPNLVSKMNGLNIKHPITQVIEQKSLPGSYQSLNIETRKTYTLQDWHDYAMGDDMRAPNFDIDGKPIVIKASRKRKASNDNAPAPLKAGEFELRINSMESATRPPVQAISHDHTASSIHNNRENITCPEAQPEIAFDEKAYTCGPLLQSSQPQSPLNNMEHSLHNESTISTIAMHGINIAASSFSIKAIPTLDEILANPVHILPSAVAAPAPSLHVAVEEPFIGPMPKPRPKQHKKPEIFKLSFDPYAIAAMYIDPEYLENLERSYWRNITYNNPSYGADLLGSLFEKSKSGGSWNLNRLDNILNKVDAPLPGVNLPYLYFGMWKSTFAWHVEDFDLYSINFIHFGAPKQWYVIPAEEASRFERLASGIFPQEANRCPQFLRHKSVILSPKLLASNNITVRKLTHHAGEFMITFPHAYHQGYNLGFNCAESVNFANEAWIDIGKRASFCKCISDSVQMDVEGLFGDPSILARANVKRKVGNDTFGIARKMTRIVAPVIFKPVVYTGPRCILCHNYEGTLIPTDSGSSVCHVECGLGVPETRVVQEENVVRVIGIANVPKGRWNLKCYICKVAKSPGSKTAGAPIQCIKGACKRAFHVSCAKRTFVCYKYNPDTLMSECYCPQHDPTSFEDRKALLQKQKEEHAVASFTVGVKVVVSDKGHSYEGEISKVLMQDKACMVAFQGTLDTSFSLISWLSMRLESDTDTRPSAIPVQEKPVKKAKPLKKKAVAIAVSKVVEASAEIGECAAMIDVMGEPSNAMSK